MGKKRATAAEDAAPVKKEAKCHQLSHREKEKLFKQYIVPNFSSIKSLTRRYTDHYQDVEENYNYCLAQLYNYIGSYDPKMKLDTWIHICTKRACFNQNKRRAEESSHYTDVEMCTPEELYQNGNSMMVDAGFGTLADNLSDKMYNALMSIPPHRLSPFLLFVQGHGIREITSMEYKMGHMEKKSEDLVKSRIYWARKELKYILKKHGITRKCKKGALHDRVFDQEDDQPEMEFYQ